MKKEYKSKLESGIGCVILNNVEWFNNTKDIKIIILKNITDDLSDIINHLDSGAVIFDLNDNEMCILTKSKEVCEMFSGYEIYSFDEMITEDHHLRYLLKYSKNIDFKFYLDRATISIALILLALNIYLCDVTVAILTTCVMLFLWYGEYRFVYSILIKK